MTEYALAYVPAASRAAAEAAVAPYLLGPGNVFTVALSPSGALPATAYGCCAPLSDDGSLAAALPGLKAAIPGSDFHTVPVDSYIRDSDWVAWLAAAGLQPIVTTP